jgi:hypothetical protein
MTLFPNREGIRQVTPRQQTDVKVSCVNTKRGSRELASGEPGVRGPTVSVYYCCTPYGVLNYTCVLS